MRRVNAACGQTLNIGRAGENMATQVVFDIADWISLFGIGNVSLLVRRKIDQQSYPVSVTVEGDFVKWVVSNLDTASAGLGQVELIYTVNKTVVKSQIWQTYVADSLDGSSPANPESDPWTDYVSQVIKAADEAKKAAEKVRETLAHPPKIENGTFWTWDSVSGKYKDSGSPVGMLRSDADKRYLQLTGGTMQTTMQRIKFLNPEDEALMASALEVWEENDLGIGLYGGGIVFLNKKNINAASFIDATQSGVIQFYETYDETGYSRPIRLNGLADPEDDDDAPNKKYVDDTIKAAVGDISAALDAINGEVA